jgi:hypothetical protein
MALAVSVQVQQDAAGGWGMTVSNPLESLFSQRGMGYERGASEGFGNLHASRAS